MIIADASYQAGQLIGLGILVLIAVGLVRTFTRGDLSWREKFLGKKKHR